MLSIQSTIIQPDTSSAQGLLSQARMKLPRGLNRPIRYPAARSPAVRASGWPVSRYSATLPGKNKKPTSWSSVSGLSSTAAMRASAPQAAWA